MERRGRSPKRFCEEEYQRGKSLYRSSDYRSDRRLRQRRDSRTRYESPYGRRRATEDRRSNWDDQVDSSREGEMIPEYDEWMRDQGWIRNYEGSWERRNGRYWEKMQYYEKYREWEMERTLELERSKDLHRKWNTESGGQGQITRKKEECNRRDREQQEIQFPNKKNYKPSSSSISSKDRIFILSARERSLVRNSSSRKRSYPVHGDDKSHEVSSAVSSSTSSNAHFKKRSRSSESFSTFDAKSNDLHRRRSSCSENESPIRNKMKLLLNQVDLEFRNDAEQIARKEVKEPSPREKPGKRSSSLVSLPKSNGGNKPRCKSLDRRFSTQEFQKAKLDVDMVNMEITVLNHMDEDSLARNLNNERKEIYNSKDNLKQKQRCVKATEHIEEYPTEEEDKDSTECSDDSDESSKESTETDATESSDDELVTKKMLKNSPEEKSESNNAANLKIPNTMQEDLKKLTPLKIQKSAFDDLTLNEDIEGDKRNDNLKATEMVHSEEKVDRMDGDEIDLNISQDLFKVASTGDITDKLNSDPIFEESNIAKEKELDVKRIEENVASIEKQISDLRAKII